VCIDQAEDKYMYFNYNMDRFWISNPTSSYKSFGRVCAYICGTKYFEVGFIEYDYNK
jgi:hypothetical protein